MLFEHAQDPARELCRIERDGTRVTVQHHRTGDRGRTDVVELDTFEAARAEYDRQIVAVYERGYRLVRDWIDPPLRYEPALEAMIAEDPYDDARWMVLADWILTQDDARANIVRFEQSRRSRDASETWGQFPIALFGGAHEAALLTEPLATAEWHAGHVRACQLRLDERYAGEVLAALAIAPATRLVRDLQLDCASADIFAAALAALAQMPCRAVLRRLILHCRAPVAPESIAPLLARTTAPALSTLGLAMQHDEPLAPFLDQIAASPLLPQLRGLELGPHETQINVLRGRYGNAFDHLQSLRVRVGNY